MKNVSEKVIKELYDTYGFIELNFHKFEEICFRNVEISDEYAKLFKSCKKNIVNYVLSEIENDGVCKILEKATKRLELGKAVRLINDLIIKNDIEISQDSLFEIANDPDYIAYFKNQLYQHKKEIDQCEYPYSENGLIYQVIDIIRDDKIGSFTTDTEKDYLSRIGKYKVLTRDEETELFKRLKTGDKEAEKKLIEHNLKLVVSIAKYYIKYNSKFTFGDLIQEGNMALIEKLGSYDPDKGYKFSTYITWWIRQRITRAIIDKGFTIRVPVHMYDRARKLNTYRRTVLQETGKEPTDEEIMEAFNLTREGLKNIKEASTICTPASIDKKVGPDDGKSSSEDSELIDFLSTSEDESPEIIAMRNTLKDEQELVLKKILTPREYTIIKLRFGLDDDYERTLETIGQQFDLTRERIRQIQNKAMKKLQAYYSSKRLQSKEPQENQKPNKKTIMLNMTKLINKHKFRILKYAANYESIELECNDCGYTMWINLDDINKDIMCHRCECYRIMGKKTTKLGRSIIEMKLCDRLGISNNILQLLVGLLNYEEVSVIKEFVRDASKTDGDPRYNFIITKLNHFLSYFKIKDKMLYRSPVSEQLIGITDGEQSLLLKEYFEANGKKEELLSRNPIITSLEMKNYIDFINKLVVMASATGGRKRKEKMESMRNKKTIYEIINPAMDKRIIDELISRLDDEKKAIIEKRMNVTLTARETGQLTNAIQKLQRRVKKIIDEDIDYKSITLHDLKNEFPNEIQAAINSLKSLNPEYIELLNKKSKSLELSKKEVEEYIIIIILLRIKLGVYDQKIVFDRKKSLSEICGTTEDVIEEIIKTLPVKDKELIEKRKHVSLNKKELIQFSGVCAKIKKRVPQYIAAKEERAREAASESVVKKARAVVISRPTIYDMFNADKSVIDEIISELTEEERKILEKRCTVGLNRDERSKFLGIYQKIRHRLDRIKKEAKKNATQENNELNGSRKDQTTEPGIIKGYGQNEMLGSSSIIELKDIKKETVSQKEACCDVASETTAIEEIVSEKESAPVINEREQFYNSYLQNLSIIIKDPVIVSMIPTRELIITCTRLGIGENMVPRTAAMVALFFGETAEEVDRITKSVLSKLNNYMTSLIQNHQKEQQRRLKDNDI